MLKRAGRRLGRFLREVPPTVEAEDPFELQRYVSAHRLHKETVLIALLHPETLSRPFHAWMLQRLMPMPKHMDKFGSAVNRNENFALFDPPGPTELTGELSTRAFLRLPRTKEGICLRDNYIELAIACAVAHERVVEASTPVGQTAAGLLGVVERRKLVVSARHFEHYTAPRGGRAGAVEDGPPPVWLPPKARELSQPLPLEGDPAVNKACRRLLAAMREPTRSELHVLPDDEARYHAADFLGETDKSRAAARDISAQPGGGGRFA